MENQIFAVGMIENISRAQAEKFKGRQLTLNYSRSTRRLHVHLNNLVSTSFGVLRFSVPSFLVPHLASNKLLLHSVEQGGSVGAVGQATITCGLSGKPLRAYWVSLNYSPCGIHAKFTVVEKMATVSATINHENTEIVVKRHIASFVDGLAVVTTEVTDRWDDIRFVPRYHAYEDAAKAAADKASHINCIEPHYTNIT